MRRYGWRLFNVPPAWAWGMAWPMYLEKMMPWRIVTMNAAHIRSGLCSLLESEFLTWSTFVALLQAHTTRAWSV